MKTEIHKLTPYEFERHCLDNPQATTSFYINGQVICQTPAGYFMYKMPVDEKEFFRFGLNESMELLEDAQIFCDKHKQEVLFLEEMSSRLQPLGLSAVSINLKKQSCILAAMDGSRYYSISTAAAKSLTAKAVSSMLTLPECKFNNPHDLAI